MKIFRFISSHSSKFFLFFILLGLLSGGLNSLLLLLVNSGLDAIRGDQVKEANYTPALIYTCGLLLFILSQRIFQRFLINLTEQIIYKIRIGILDALRNCSLSSFEKIGESQVYAVLTRDSITISTAASAVVFAFTSLVTVLFCLAYLAWISLTGFSLVMLVVLAGVLLFWLRQRKIMAGFEKARDMENSFFSYIRSLLGGIREMKLNQKKNDDLFSNYIGRASEDARAMNTRSTLQYLDNALTGHLAFMLLVGFLVYLFPYFSGVQAPVIVSFVIITLYILGPLQGIMQTIPIISRANISVGRIEELEEKIKAEGKAEMLRQPAESVQPVGEIGFDAITYTYPAITADAPFSVGPLSFTVKKGEIVFIVGGNGSGKTTLFKLLSGLYVPENGQIVVNGNAVDESNRGDYKSRFSAVFSEGFLFDYIYGANGNEHEKFEYWVRRLQLTGKVQLEGRKLTSISLSSGQRKRLALILALLEERPVLLLDEWAADQDPVFRKFFYEELLPEIRDSGKTIIAITHDDRYFHVCDKLLKMEYGQLSEIDKKQYQHTYA